jgi:hypothetical protein
MKKIIIFVFVLVTVLQYSSAQERAAVGKFKTSGQLTTDDASTLRSTFQSELVKTGKYEVAELDDEELSRVQRQFENSTYNERDRTVALGNALKANIIFTGEIRKFDDDWTVTINMYDMTKKTITKTENFNFQGAQRELLAKMRQSAQKLTDTYVEESGNTWYYVGGVLLIGGGAAAVLLGKKSADEVVTDTGLPEPPNKPN